MYDLTNIRKHIEDAIERHVANGGEVQRGRFGVTIGEGGRYNLCEYSGCCAIGCYVLGRETASTPLAAAARDLGVSKEWIGSFVYGFDGSEMNGHMIREAYELGRSIGSRLDESR